MQREASCDKNERMVLGGRWLVNLSLILHVKNLEKEEVDLYNDTYSLAQTSFVFTMVIQPC